MAKVSGWAVLRRPEHAFGGSSRLPAPLQLNGVYYGGAERLAWDDVKTAFKVLDASKRTSTLSNTIERLNTVGDDLRLVDSFDDALEALHLSPEIQQQNEICGFYSEVHSFPSFDSGISVSESGIDVMSWVGSLLSQGLFTKPSAFEGFRVNARGLLERDAVDEYVKRYISVQDKAKANLEPVALSDVYMVTVFKPEI
jgi:hypothetical protein